MEAKTIPGVFIGYHIHAGGLWSGDNLTAHFAPFRRDCNVAKSKVKIHRTKEMVTSHTWKFTFPVATLRQKTASTGRRKPMPHTDEEMGELVDTSDDEAQPRVVTSRLRSQTRCPHPRLKHESPLVGTSPPQGGLLPASGPVPYTHI